MTTIHHDHDSYINKPTTTLKKLIVEKMGSPFVDANEANISIMVLRVKTKTMISSLLNPLKLFRSHKGVPRDWQGLAELCNISGELIPNLSQDQDATAHILKLWHSQSKEEATIGNLINYFEELDRSDVTDDVLPLIKDDLKYFKEHPPNGKTVKPFDLSAEDILTSDDIRRFGEGLDPQLYDAFVLFDQDDIGFATEVIETMEKSYDLKFCVKERDLVGGSFELDAVIKLIAQRCARLVVIISDAFLQSHDKFFYSLAQSISIKEDSRKIIPCIYKECGKLPPQLECLYKLDYRRSGTFWNFWDKLYDAIIVPGKVTDRSKSENCLFREGELHPELPIGSSVARSGSYSEHFPASLPPSNTSTSKSVNFSLIMSQLPNTEVPEDIIVPSTSVNNLGINGTKTLKKGFSFKRTFKNLIKSDKKRSTDQQQPVSNEKSNTENTTEETASQNTGDDNQNLEKDIKPEKKEKIKIFSRRKKKKPVLADT